MKNKINISQIKIENAPKGLYPYIFNEKLKEDIYQIIIFDKIEKSKFFFEHIKKMNNKYIFLDIENELYFQDTIFKILKEKYSLITTNNIYNKLFPNKKNIKNIQLKTGVDIDPFYIMDILSNKQMERVDSVYERGEYALRGSILDIYDYINKPIRIEFDFDKIISIRQFDIKEQISVKNLDNFNLYFSEKYEEKYSYREFFDKYKIYNINEIFLEYEPQKDICENINFKNRSINGFREWVKNYKEYEINIFCTNDYEVKRLKNIFGKKYNFYNYNIFEGFIFHTEKKIFINDYEIFKRKRFLKIQNDFESIPLENINDLNPGDIVVHQTYGIGRFAGIEKVSLGNRETDCLKIYYDKNDKLFVPVDQIHLIDKYYSTSDKVKLSPLSKTYFKKQKEKVKKSLKQIAGELIRLYAEREMSKGYAFSGDNELMIDMEEHFEFDETEDQIKAIEDIKKDMQSEKIMNRLICGEVGFGKTEVAARAAFKCVLDNKQVVFLVPTTILAEQHYRTLSERLKDYGINIAMYSRFINKKQRDKIKEQLRNGKIDIIIGTHGLLAKDMEFKDIGLLIIDEEHRFGVKQKEKIIDMKRNIDVLYMSATPIPRTLEMVFSGIKDISNILTPPVGRKPVNTHIVKWDEKTIKNAIEYELSRNGQIYFVNNRIETLKSIAEKIKKIMPECKIKIAHAKLKPKELENIMLDFWDRKFDLLLSTAIIESGIDNPNANTMIINRGDMFGLAQLHQLRGRIGRSEKEAFCYIIIHSKNKLSLNARRRLSAFKSYSSLGAGMQLAMKDLEIRGAGNLLGTKQHGNIGIVGFTMYFKLLKQAIDEIKGEKHIELVEPTINIPVKTFFPDELYISKRGKIEFYKEIANIDKIENIYKIKEKFKDKMGKLPKEAENLFHLQETKLLCKKTKISKIAYNKGRLIIEFFINYQPELKLLNRIISNIENKFEINYSNPFKIIIYTENVKIEYINLLLKNLL